jgi:hypothetical protein
MKAEVWIAKRTSPLTIEISDTYHERDVNYIFQKGLKHIQNHTTYHYPPHQILAISYPTQEKDDAE